MTSASSLLNGQFLLLAQDALVLGDTRTGRRFAKVALDRSRKQTDREHWAKSLLVMAQADSQDSRFNRALNLSTLAVQRFEDTQDTAGLADALALAGYAASALQLPCATGLAQRGALLRQCAEDLAQASSLNYLGITSLWTQDFKGADDTLEAAVWYADGSPSAAAAFQPEVNRCFAEAFRLFCQAQEPLPDLTRLFALHTKCTRRLARGEMATLSASAPGAGILAMLDFIGCFAHARAGNLEPAFRYALACEAHASRLSGRNWGRALVWWARCELARSRRDSFMAATYAQQVIDVARAGEHVQMERVGQRLLDSLKVC